MDPFTRSPALQNALEDTGEIPTVFGRLEAAPAAATPHRPDFERIQRSREFVTLRSRSRRFIFPMSLLFFAWYMTYVLLAAYAHGFMSVTVFGQVNIAILLGLLQFVTTAVITASYVRFARRRLDPQAERIRQQAGVENPR